MEKETPFNSYTVKTRILNSKNNNCNKSGVFMLKKDLILINLMSKQKLKHFEMEDKIIIHLNKKIDKDNLVEALKIKRINEIVESIKKTLPKIKMREMESVKCETIQKKFIDLTKFASQPKFKANPKIKYRIKSESKVSFEIMKIDPFKDTIHHKLTKYKKPKRNKSVSDEMFESTSLTSYIYMNQSTSSTNQTKNEIKHSINISNEKNIFRTSVHFIKENLKNKCRVTKLIRNISADRKLIDNKCSDNKLIANKTPDHKLIESRSHYQKLVENKAPDNKQFKNNKNKSEIIDSFVSIYVDKSITGW